MPLFRYNKKTGRIQRIEFVKPTIREKILNWLLRIRQKMEAKEEEAAKKTLDKLTKKTDKRST
jgi:hypothetical protein